MNRTKLSQIKPNQTTFFQMDTRASRPRSDGQQRPAYTKKDQSLPRRMTNDETMPCRRAIVLTKNIVVAGESGVAATALPPQSKIAAGGRWFF
ncbi:MAG: hypothetical protein JF609_11640 [Verrucomicrobia bacterium]|nr:hypothetical protein [Verrucomicrobiota bacterium]